VNQLAQLPLRKLAIGDHAGELILYLAQHVDRLPQPLAASRVGRRPSLPGGDVVVLELLEGLLQQLVLDERLGARAPREIETCSLSSVIAVPPDTRTASSDLRCATRVEKWTQARDRAHPTPTCDPVDRLSARKI
jgi:hypothetical protein